MTTDQRMSALEGRIERTLESIERQAQAVTVLDLRLEGLDRSLTREVKRIERHLHVAAVALTHIANIRTADEFVEALAVVEAAESVQGGGR